MIDKPDPTDFVLWHRSPCTQWLLEQLHERYDHSRDWTTVKSWDTFNLLVGHQEVINHIRSEI